MAEDSEWFPDKEVVNSTMLLNAVPTKCGSRILLHPVVLCEVTHYMSRYNVGIQ